MSFSNMADSFFKKKSKREEDTFEKEANKNQSKTRVRFHCKAHQGFKEERQAVCVMCDATLSFPKQKLRTAGQTAMTEF